MDERPFKGEDPQIIFETLNSLGKPLTLSDLVRNFVLLNMKSDKQAEIYENIWHPKIELVLQDNTSKFFRDYLQYQTSRSVKVVSDGNTKEVYNQFKSYVEDNFQNHGEFIGNIVPFVAWYNWIISEIVVEQISTNKSNDKEIKELLRNIFHDIKSEAFKPLVLGLLKFHQKCTTDSEMADGRLISILQTIRTYLIRRRILGLTQGENKDIVLLSNKSKDLFVGRLEMIDLLTSLSYNLRLPNDLDMEEELRSMNFYEGLKKFRSSY